MWLKYLIFLKDLWKWTNISFPMLQFLFLCKMTMICRQMQVNNQTKEHFNHILRVPYCDEEKTKEPLD